MIELAYILMMVLGGGLFAFGGWGIEPPVWYQGKYWRRYVLPASIIGLLFWVQCYLPIETWQIIGSGLTLCFVTHLGYGEDKTWGYRVLVAGSYSLPSLWFGWTWWLIITPSIFIALFIGSNYAETSKDFTWKICEFLTGSFIMITIIGALQRLW